MEPVTDAFADGRSHFAVSGGPSDQASLQSALDDAEASDRPSVIRLPRGACRFAAS